MMSLKSRSLVTVLLLSAFVLAGIPPVYAADWLGMATPSTPFDSKMASAGVLGLRSVSFGQMPVVEADELFRVARSFRYRKDTRGDRWQSPEETGHMRAGDCEDMALWLYAKLLEGGRSDARLVIGRYQRLDRGLHVWVTLTTPKGKVLILDPAKNKRVWESSSLGTDLYLPYFSYGDGSSYRHLQTL